MPHHDVHFKMGGFASQTYNYTMGGTTSLLYTFRWATQHRYYIPFDELRRIAIIYRPCRANSYDRMISDTMGYATSLTYTSPSELNE